MLELAVPLLPRRVTGTVPLARLLAFRLVRLAPLPEKVPPVMVPLSVGEVERTTLPVPVDAVLHPRAVVLVAAQKSPLVKPLKLGVAVAGSNVEMIDSIT